MNKLRLKFRFVFLAGVFLSLIPQAKAVTTTIISHSTATLQAGATISVSLARINTLTTNSVNLSSGSLTVSTLTVTGLSTLKGTTTNDNAPVGYIGEFSSTATAGAVNFASTGNLKEIVVTTVTAGDYDVYVMASQTLNGATLLSGFQVSFGSGPTGTTLLQSFTGASATTLSNTTVSYYYRLSIANTTRISLQVGTDYTDGPPKVSQAELDIRRAR